MTRQRFWQPVFRSRRNGHRHLRFGAVICIGLTTWVGPPVLMLVFGLPFMWISNLSEAEIWQVLTGPLELLIPSLFTGLVLVPVGLLCGVCALRIGFAGMGVALSVAGLLPLAFGLVFELAEPRIPWFRLALDMAPIWMLQALIMWCATRAWASDCLLDPER